MTNSIISLDEGLLKVEQLLQTSFVRKMWGPKILQDLTPKYLDLPGKRLRPSLVLVGCGLMGGDLQNVIPVAAAYEVFHNWTLVHDDIIDNDSFRRGYPTAHCQASQWGIDHKQLLPEQAQKLGKQTAILIGDNLQAWSINLFLQMIDKSKIPTTLILSELKRMTGEAIPLLIHGEMSDVLNSYLPIEQCSVEDVCEMMRLKTSILFQYSLTTGAVLGSQCAFCDLPEAEALEVFANSCGIAFQLQDDLLGVFGNEKKFGKKVGADLCEGKRTLLLIYALNSANSQQRQQILALIGKPNINEDELSTVRSIFVDTGAVQQVQQKIKEQIYFAEASLEKLPNNLWRDWLKNLMLKMTRREK